MALPWGLAGAAVGALVAVLAMQGWSRERGSAAPSDPAAAAGGSPSPALRAPDISQMSPEERATRLFNRVEELAEAGKQDSVQFFLPMALGAYAQLPALDLDARYHIGLLDLAGGDAAAAIAQADTIRRTTPTHLFAFVLQAHAREAKGDARGARRAYADFLRNERAERARNRPEYQEHDAMLRAFHTDALAKANGR